MSSRTRSRTGPLGQGTQELDSESDTERDTNPVAELDTDPVAAPVTEPVMEPMTTMAPLASHVIQGFRANLQKKSQRLQTFGFDPYFSAYIAVTMHMNHQLKANLAATWSSHWDHVMVPFLEGALHRNLASPDTTPASLDDARAHLHKQFGFHLGVAALARMLDASTSVFTGLAEFDEWVQAVDCMFQHEPLEYTMLTKLQMLCKLQRQCTCSRLVERLATAAHQATSGPATTLTRIVKEALDGYVPTRDTLFSVPSNRTAHKGPTIHSAAGPKAANKQAASSPSRPPLRIPAQLRNSEEFTKLNKSDKQARHTFARKHHLCYHCFADDHQSKACPKN